MTLRENTERPVTVDEGTNRLAGGNKKEMVSAFREVCKNDDQLGKVPELWDGRAAKRIMEIINRNVSKLKAG